MLVSAGTKVSALDTMLIPGLENALRQGADPKGAAKFYLGEVPVLSHVPCNVSYFVFADSGAKFYGEKSGQPWRRHGRPKPTVRESNRHGCHLALVP